MYVILLLFVSCCYLRTCCDCCSAAVCCTVSVLFVGNWFKQRHRICYRSWSVQAVQWRCVSHRYSFCFMHIIQLICSWSAVNCDQSQSCFGWFVNLGHTIHTASSCRAGFSNCVRWSQFNSLQLLRHDELQVLLCRLDHCLFLCHSFLQCLQLLHNAAARLIFRTHLITLVLDTLCLLPVWKRITFKMVVLVLKYLHHEAHHYLFDICVPVASTQVFQHLRSVLSGISPVPLT